MPQAMLERRRTTSGQAAAIEIPLDQIVPSPTNPRQNAADALDELAASMAEYGLLQPVLVRPLGSGYELADGHRRLAAAQQLGWKRIPAVVRDVADDGQAYLLTLTANLQREDLSPREESEALEVLVRDWGWSTRQVAEAIKRDHSYVSRRLRVFDDPALAPLVISDRLAVSTAEELLRVPDAQERKALAKQAAREGWTRTQARAAIGEEAPAVRGAPPTPNVSRQAVTLIRELRALIANVPLDELSRSAISHLRSLNRDLSAALSA